ncbi:MAG: tRNA uridine-5-carboxymethylaminomethyl(34) synthesis GTPase MnmE [Gemmatimonadota bacterium]
MLSDPIVALATTPGRSALGVVRLSGRGAFAIAREVMRSEPTHAIVPRRAELASFYDRAGGPIDQGLVTFFPAPHSYTGEDLVEFSCHGGLLVPATLQAAIQAAGARGALPGEFTRRAVLNGKLDLLQAEAIGDLIDATARSQARGALRQLDGGLSRRIGQLRDRLLELLALLSYDIDFPEEDDGPIDRARVIAQWAETREAVGRLVASAPLGERLRAGALVVLAGRPNVGKSSLFNALLGTARALVTEVPGTTRDAIEMPTEIAGWPVRLVDTAGLRNSDDPVERLGVEVSHRFLGAADLVLLCAEAGRSLAPDEVTLALDPRVLTVRTKGDLAPRMSRDITVSTVTGEGLGGLSDVVAGRLFAGAGAGGADLEPLLTRERHRVSLERAAVALDRMRPHLDPGSDAVLAAHHGREAVAALDELIGVVDVEEVLGRVFERFCVGK